MALSMVTVGMSVSLANAVTFGSTDIVNGEIAFNYNPNGDAHYLNGVSTGSGFVATVDSAANIAGYGGGFLCPEWGMANAGAVRSFVYKFEMPVGYEVSSVDVGWLFVSAPGSGSNNYMRLYVSTDGAMWNEFAASSPTINDWKGDFGVTDISSYVAGSSVYYIKGAFDFTSGSGSDYSDTLQMFRSDVAGVEGVTFTNTIGVTVVPEPMTLALLSLGVLPLSRRRAVK
jgi:hypothetical protein